MNNLKDTQKTDVKKYGQSDVPDTKTLSDMSIYDFVCKKTEKLVTALYLVSDCMETDDALKEKLRSLGVELLSDIYKLSNLSPVDKRTHTAISLSHIYELLSFIEIAHTIGFISEMNTMVLEKEFSSLASDLKENLEKDKHFTFTLDEQMFSTGQGLVRNGKDFNYRGQSSIKDKRTSFNTMSFINNKSPSSSLNTPKINSSTTSLADRQDRTNKIISLIKGKIDISIKDISLAFTDCSEKTIQRELNSLVSKGQLKKTGSKRWSRYSMVTN